MVADDRGGEDRAGATCARGGDRGVGQDLGRGAGAQDAPVLERDDGGGEARDLRRRVADIEDGDDGLSGEAFEIGQDLGLAGLVEGGEGLVGDEEAGGAQERAPDGDALRLAARERAGTAVEQCAEPQEADDAGRVAALGAGARRRP